MSQLAGECVYLTHSKCAEVCEPQEGLTTNWPPGMEGRCFVVCSPNRAHYIIAESEEDKKYTYVAKLPPTSRELCLSSESGSRN